MKYITAYDVTPKRCTVIENFERREDAEAAADGDPEIKVFAVDKAIEPGTRAFHSILGRAWS